MRVGVGDAGNVFDFQSAGAKFHDCCNRSASAKS